MKNSLAVANVVYGKKKHVENTPHLRQVLRQVGRVAERAGIRVVHSQVDDRESARAQHGSRLLPGHRRPGVDLESDFVPVEDGVVLGGGVEGESSDRVDRLSLGATEVLLGSQVDLVRVVGDLGRDDSRDVGKDTRLRRVERAEEAADLCGDVRVMRVADRDIGRERRTPLPVDDHFGVGADGGDLFVCCCC